MFLLLFIKPRGAVRVLFLPSWEFVCSSVHTVDGSFKVIKTYTHIYKKINFRSPVSRKIDVCIYMLYICKCIHVLHKMSRHRHTCPVSPLHSSQFLPKRCDRGEQREQTSHHNCQLAASLGGQRKDHWWVSRSLLTHCVGSQIKVHAGSVDICRQNRLGLKRKENANLWHLVFNCEHCGLRKQPPFAA